MARVHLERVAERDLVLGVDAGRGAAADRHGHECEEREAPIGSHASSPCVCDSRRPVVGPSVRGGAGHCQGPRRPPGATIGRPLRPGTPLADNARVPGPRGAGHRLQRSRSMSLTLFKNAKLLDPTKADLQDGVAVLVEGARIREVSPRPIRTSGADRRRRGRPDADARPDRLPRARVPLRGQHPGARGRCPLTLLDGAGARRSCAPCSTAASRRCATRAARTGASGRRSSAGYLPGPRLFIAGRADRPDERPQRPAPADRPRAAAVPLMQRDGVHHGDRRRRDRGAAGRPRAAPPGRRPHQDHGVGRRGLALRPARQPPVLDRRDPRRRRGGHRLQALRLRSRLPGEGDRPRGRVRGAGDRARQPDRRAPRRSSWPRRSAFLVPTLVAYDAINAPRGRVRHGPREPREEQGRAGGRSPLARARQAGGRPHGLRVAISSASSSPTSRRSSSCEARRSARARSSTRRRSSGPSSSAARASSA